VQRFVKERGGRIITPEFIEVETGKRNDRPELVKALKRCRLTGACLLVAKLDRLSRNVVEVFDMDGKFDVEREDEGDSTRFGTQVSSGPSYVEGFSQLDLA
jgi:hypothetical protein